MRKLLTTALVGLVGALGVAGCGSNNVVHHHPSHAKVTQTCPGFVTKYGCQAHSPTFGVPPVGVKLKAPGPPVKAQPTVTMLDSVDSSPSIFAPFRPQVVAGYTSGSWPTYWDYRGHFKSVVAVMVNTSHFGVPGAAISCLDVEPHDATPSQVGQWMHTEVSNHFKPCAYGSLSEWSAINSSISAWHIPGHIYRWCAEWTYHAHLTPGCDATQWTDHFANQNIDGSVATLAFANLVRHIKPKPKPVYCFGKGWRHTAFCNKLRQEAVDLGRLIKKEDIYLVQTNKNIKSIQGQITVLQRRLGVVTNTGKVEGAKRDHAYGTLTNLCKKYSKSGTCR